MPLLLRRSHPRSDFRRLAYESTCDASRLRGLDLRQAAFLRSGYSPRPKPLPSSNFTLLQVLALSTPATALAVAVRSSCYAFDDPRTCPPCGFHVPSQLRGVGSLSSPGQVIESILVQYPLSDRPPCDDRASWSSTSSPHLSMVRRIVRSHGLPTFRWVHLSRWRCSWCRGLVHLSMRALAAAIVSQPPPHPCGCFEVCAFALAYVLRRLRRLPDDCASSPIGRPRRTMSSRLPSRCLRSCSSFDVHARIRSRLPTVVRSTHFHEQNVPRSSSALVHDQELLAVHTFLCLPCAPLDAHG
jgi:hypothetical protein